MRKKAMKQHATSITMSVLALAIILLPSSAFGQDDIPGVTGAGASAFPIGTILSGVSLTGLQFGVSASIPGDASAEGQFQATLLGTTLLGLQQKIEIEGTATSGSNGPGSRTFSGTATVDMCDGPLPLANMPNTVTATATSLLLSIGTTNLPVAALTAGTINIE